eukprot:1705376-Pleurochrysis_carterae.AAC.1
MAERHLSKYVSSTRANSCDSLSGFTEAHEVTEAFIRVTAAIERYLEPEDFAADQYGSSDSTFSNDDAGPSAEVPKLAPEFANAEPLEEADVLETGDILFTIFLCATHMHFSMFCPVGDTSTVHRYGRGATS